MNKIKHPTSRFERLVNAEKKAQAKARRKVSDSAIRAVREQIKVKELEDAVGEDS